ncbi:MAG: Hpt domain-containing protein [Balneolaceae bacterium]
MNIDLSYLENITAGDEEMIMEMLNLFIEDIPKQVTKIHELAENKELQKLGAEAHKIKPTLQYVGLFEMYEIVKSLESFGKQEVYSPQIIELVEELNTLSKEASILLENKRQELS